MSWRSLGLMGGVAVWLFSAAPAWALQGFGVSPTSQELNLQPGGIAHGALTVINDGDSAVTYRLYTTDYHVQGEDYVGDFSDRQAAADVSPVSWFELPKGLFTVAARQQVKVPYDITVPRTATVGGHYAAVFAETVPPANASGTYIARVERVGSLFYVAVGGQARPHGQVLPLVMPWLQATAPVAATLRVQNDGNVHALAEGSARLTRPFGGGGEVTAFRGEVLPGTVRRFNLKLPAPAALGLYRAEAQVHVAGRTQTVAHWVLLVPRLTFLIVGGTVMLALGLGLWGLMRRARRHH